jgi:TetR/AcrR family transcriptional regulator, tetracycline repressor protein
VAGARHDELGCDPVTGDFNLDADEIVDAAIEIFQEKGLDAVSMRSVSSRLGVSPVPLYNRVGNKEALVEAVADRLLTDLVPGPEEGEPWPAYAIRWAQALREGTRRTRDSRLILYAGRNAYVDASRPLVDVLRSHGFEPDAAVQACRLLTWATVGFSAVESGAEPPRRRRRTRPGGDPGGVDAAEIDALFELHIRYITDGIEREASR